MTSTSHCSVCSSRDGTLRCQRRLGLVVAIITVTCIVWACVCNYLNDDLPRWVQGTLTLLHADIDT